MPKELNFRKMVGDIDNIGIYKILFTKLIEYFISNLVLSNKPLAELDKNIIFE